MADGKIILVGGVVEPMTFGNFSLIGSRKSIGGSLIGGNDMFLLTRYLTSFVLRVHVCLCNL